MAALKPHSNINRIQAVRFIASEVSEPGELARLTRNRVNKRIGYDVSNGRLQEVAPGVFKFGRLIAWARNAYVGKFLNWPALHEGSGAIQMPCVTVEANAEIQPPADLGRCQSLVRELTRSLNGAYREIEALRVEVGGLRRFKADVMRKREEGRQAAERSRHPR